jgi:tRNA pseudouridine38-40 synthase
MSAFKLVLAYDGTDYVGWQRQASGVSIQGLLEGALREFGDRDVAVAGAGRTDAGVHALGQVASFTLERSIDAGTLGRALNAKLPPDVRVRSAEDAPPAFHARFDARAKTYRYRICNAAVVLPFDRRYVWHVPGALDVEAMARAARLFEGVHDFAAFQGAGSDTPTTDREIFASRVAVDADRMIDYEITGSGFLRHMVRAIAGTLVEVGGGRRDPESMRALVASADRTLAGRTAPAEGLVLVSVDYVK